MTGCAVITPGRAVVVAEGTAKAHKRYGKLMLQRIDWNEHKEDEDVSHRYSPVHVKIFAGLSSMNRPALCCVRQLLVVMPA